MPLCADGPACPFAHKPTPTQGSSAELRELAAEGLGELVEVTGEDALKPFVVQVSGRSYCGLLGAALTGAGGELVEGMGEGALKPIVVQVSRLLG